MTQLVTRCPQCSTSFRITQAQIQKARGAVRCGSCLHIFNAQQNLIGDSRPKPPAQGEHAPKRVAPTPPPTQAQLPISTELETQKSSKPKVQSASNPKAAAAETQAHSKSLSGAQATPVETGKRTQVKESSDKPQLARDGLLSFDQAQIDLESELGEQVLISDDMDSPASDADDNLYLAPSDNTHSLFERKAEQQKERFIDTSDESWAHNLLEDDVATAAPQPDSHFDNPLSITRAEHSDNNEPTHDPDADSDADALSSANHPNKQDVSATSAPPKPLFHLRAEHPDTAPQDSQPHNGEPQEPHERLHAYDHKHSDLLMGIAREPVEMSSAQHSPWRKRLQWGGLCLVALVALALQTAWLQFDRYSRIEPYRQYYQSVCNLMGCQLPILRDTSQIRAFNLVIRQHPEQNGALMVDAIILNSAHFDQPFPALKLSFSDIHNKPVASRRFTPAEYLRGELAGRTIMPSNQPVHLSLELSDPGADAVNYRLVIPQ